MLDKRPTQIGQVRRRSLCNELFRCKNNTFGIQLSKVYGGMPNMAGTRDDGVTSTGRPADSAIARGGLVTIAEIG